VLDYLDISTFQVSAPTKNKCQCHVVQQPSGNNRGAEGESDGSIEVASRTHQPPALPPRPPPKPTRRYETTATNHCKRLSPLCMTLLIKRERERERERERKKENNCDRGRKRCPLLNFTFDYQTFRVTFTPCILTQREADELKITPNGIALEVKFARAVRASDTNGRFAM